MTERRYGLFYELEVRGRTSEIEQQKFHECLEQIELGDKLGYNSTWFVEHHFTRGFSHSSAPDLILAAAARTTENIRLGLSVVLLPFQSPIRIAERIATLDILSKGRVEFGTGRGASPLEYQAFKRPFEKSRALWEDHLEAIEEIFAADGKEVSREGEYYEIPGVSVLPRPVQTFDSSNMWVASTSLEGFIAAGKKGQNLLCMTMLKGLEGLAEDIKVYKQTLADNGHDPDKARIGMMIPWFVDHNVEEIDDVVSAFMWYVRRQINLVTPPDYTDARHATAKVFGQEAAGLSEREALDTLRENDMIVMGDVEDSKAAAERFFAAGCTDLIGQFQVGGLSHERVLNSMEIFTKEIMG